MEVIWTVIKIEVQILRKKKIEKNLIK